MKYLAIALLVIPQEVAIMGGLEPNHVMTGVVLGLMWLGGLYLFVRAESGDFSSFDRWCPVKGCGWSFQTDEDFAAHILKNKHGVDIT
jgi:hypothetical protein